MAHRLRRLLLLPLVLAVAALAAGCGTLPHGAEPLSSHLQATGESAACAGFFRAFDRQVSAAGVADAQHTRVPGFPYLRSSRFLASFSGELEGSARQHVWLQALHELGHRGQRVELANLPDTAATWEALGVADRAAAGQRLADCGEWLLGLDSDQPQVWPLLRERSEVADAYADYQRLLGLYPLTALAAVRGIAGLHADIRATFARPPDSLQVVGELTDYRPPAATVQQAAVDWYADVPRDALGVPQLTGQQLERLFRRHAPIWRIDVAGQADRIGAPYWDSTDSPAIDTGRPLVYRKTSYTRWRDETLLQLNYIIWFPARPKTGSLDLLGGHIDGITWRVTLDGDGSPLLYDAMHNCGCYHMAFPGAKLNPRERQSLWQEPLMVPARAPVPARGERIRIRIEQGSHYIQALEAVEDHPGTLSYSFADYNELRSLPAPGDGQRSMFDQRGLVPGTERLERWLLWPMGVPEPGAMRQWGTHATAFVGKRHFDDPDLIGRYFTASP